MTTSFLNGSVYGVGSTSVGNYYTSEVSASSWFDTEYLDKKSQYQQQQEAIAIGESARDAVMDTQISNFTTYLEDGKEDKALAAYHKLIEEMKQQTRYAGLSDGEIQAMAREIIEIELSNAAGQDVDLEDYIREHATGVAGQGWQKVFLNNNKIDDANEATLLNEICGMDEREEMTAGEKILQGAATVVLSPIKALTELGDFLFGGSSH